MRVIVLWSFLSIAGLKLSSPVEADTSNAVVRRSEDEDNEPFPPLIDTVTGSSDDITNIKRNFVSATLGSNMVLQRDQEATLWGYSTKGAIVTTSLFDDEEETDGVNQKARLVLVTRVEGNDGLWRQTLPPQKASLKASSILITATTGQHAELNNVLFGDVYICGGQSNMEFSLQGTTNGTVEANRGNNYPHVRVFTVGKGTSSPNATMPDLQTVLEPWSVASNRTLLHGSDAFVYFSSVCWFFGQEIADSLDNQIPIGLISNNWGGTGIELWLPKGKLYNAMIYPYMVGPMAVTGFAWYQGEANTGSKASANAYAKKIVQMITAWRKGFHAPQAYFGFVQLSTWCPSFAGEHVAEMRQAQMAALELENVGYATNADMGAGCNIHPPQKQFCGKRLGNSALAIQYGKQVSWKSPTFKAAAVVTAPSSRYKPCVLVQFRDVSSKGLYLIKTAYNAVQKDFTCDKAPAGTCAGTRVLLNGLGWTNATISIKNANSLLITATKGNSRTNSVMAVSYGWGSVPLMTIYDKGTDLPVLPWNEKIS